MKALSRRFALAAVAGFAAWTCGAAHAAWPERPVTIVVPYAPGGAGDAVARVLATKLGQKLGTSVVVDNKAGASGTIGEAYVAKAKPDGYTLLYGATPLAINPHIMAKMPYKPGDLQPLTHLLNIPQVIIVKADAPHKTVKDLVEHVKKQPGKVNFASGGSGTVQRLAGELFRQQLGLDMVHVGYKSGGPAITDVAGGQVDFMFASVTATQPLIQGGKLRALAVSSPQRSPRLPDVPTLADTVAPGFDVHEWNGLMLPKGVPADITQKLHKAVIEVLQDAEVKQRLADMGAQPVGSTPAAFAEFLAKENARWSEVVRKGKITVD